MGPGAPSQSVLSASHDHCLKKPLRFLPKMPLKLIGSLKILPLQLHTSNKQKTCSRNESYLKSKRVESERQRQMKLEGTRRSALLLGFTSVFEVLSVNFFKPQSMNLLAKANESSFLLDGSGRAGAEIVLQGLPFTARLSRPRMGLSKSEEELEEVLTLKLKLLRGKASAFNVFINLPDASEQTLPTCLEFAGSFFHEPRRVKSPEFEYQETIFRIGIGDVIKDLGLMDQPDIRVTFVPRGVDKELPIVLENISIDVE